MTDYHDKGADACGKLWSECDCDRERQMEELEEEIATLKAELESRNNHYEVQVGLAKMYQKQRDDAREAIDLLKVQLESYRTSANNWEMNWAKERADNVKLNYTLKGSQSLFRRIWGEGVCAGSLKECLAAMLAELALLSGNGQQAGEDGEKK